MRIAICDDEAADMEMICSALKKYDRSGRLKISTFSSAVALKNAFLRTPFDIAIMDIEMTAPNGYDVARELVALISKPIIIFVTNSLSYTIRGYGVAFRYITKPISAAQFNEAMDSAIKEITAKRFVLSINETSHVFCFEDIYYFEVFNHHTILHTIDNQFVFRSTLKDIYQQLPTGYFASPHQSYLVNFLHIKSVTSKEIHLTNGVTISISRRKQKEFELQFCAFLGR